MFAWTLLDGPLFGGVWAAANASRLGLKEQVGPCLLMAVGCTVLPLLISNRLGLPAASASRLAWSLFFRVLAAYYYLATQREAFWDGEDRGVRRSGAGLWTLAGLLLLPFNFLPLLSEP